MPIQNPAEYLAARPYPGRGVLLGLTPGGHAAIAYFIMGRSENSRNRVFTEKGEGIVTQAADESRMQDPSLIIYAPVRCLGKHTIVTNGDQTDTIYDNLAAGDSFEEALLTRTFEPDAPNYTPRISGLLARGVAGFSYRLSILKSAGGNAESAQRFFFDYPQPLAGQGHLIHTYEQNGDPLPSFTGEPRCVAVHGDINAFGEGIWQSLNADNKVSLFVRFIAPDGTADTRIYNRFEKINP